MTVKLKDYSLISNEWIDRRISQIEEAKKWCILPNQQTLVDLLDNEKQTLEYLKHQLIPAEKLADVCFEQGKSVGVINYQPLWATFDEQIKQDKETFLNSIIVLA
jgi:hypothetical protein